MSVLKSGKFWLLVGRVLLAGIFLAAGILKLREPWPTFAASIYTFKVLPDDWLEPLARTVPWFEVVLGAAVLSGVRLKWTSLAATLVLYVVYSWLVGASKLRLG